MTESQSWTAQDSKSLVNRYEVSRPSAIRLFTFAEIELAQGLEIDQRPPLESEKGKVIGHAEKLSPHEQWATAFGFVTLNPPFCKSSLKSSNDPLTNSALFGSTTTRTPSLSTMMSRFAGPSTRSILYCSPEQPPPITATRKAPCGRPCRVSNEVSFAEA